MKFNFYGLILGISFYLGYHYLRRQKLDPKIIDPLFTGLLFWGILGARAYHVLDYWDYYSQNPLQIINLPAGGLGIFGALLAGIGYLLYFCRRHQLSFWNWLNILVPFLPLAQAIGRWGNYFNHEIYSRSGLPLWLYESIGSFLLFLFIRYLKNKFAPISIYLIGYGLIRLVLDSFRNDLFTVSNFKISQILGVLFIIIGLWTLQIKKAR